MTSRDIGDDNMGAPVQLTEDQFRRLLAMVQPAGPAAQVDGEPVLALGAAAMVGQMTPCQLGKNKLKRYKKWRDWLRDAESKMDFLKLTREESKISFLKSCAGAELMEFWEKEARIRFSAVAADAARGILAADAHTYEGIKSETKSALLKLVSRDRAVIELLRMEQGTRSFMDFLSEVEDQEFLCRILEQPISSDDLKRMSLIAGMGDRTLAEKSLAEEYTLQQVIQAGINRESSKANVEAMKARPHTSVNKVEDSSELNNQSMAQELQNLRTELELMRVRPSGKYSRRFKPEESGGQTSSKDCPKCCYTHDRDKCPAEGRQCHRCGEAGHFRRSKLCRAPRKAQYTTRRIAEETPTPSDSEDETGPAYRIERVWPGVQSGVTKTKNMYYVKSKGGSKQPTSKRVKVYMGGVSVELYCDTGSRMTIIPPNLYEDKMGKVVPADCNLRAWGSASYLDTKGMFRTTLVTERGAKTDSWIYIVAGTRPEPLLGDQDAEHLGIIQFNPKGRPATPDETENTVNHMSTGRTASIPAKLRQAGIPVSSPEIRTVHEPIDRSAAEKIAAQYTGTVLTDKVGSMRIRPVKLRYEADFKPTQPPRYPVPFHYKDRLSTHLDKLRREGVIEDVDPSQPIDCVLNIAISEKKTAGSIRMNIDDRPLNLGAKHTKYHVVTPQEVRHQLEGSRVFTELDMVQGFHQVPLDPESQIVFQSHQGLHRMKRLFFGPKNSSGIFHHEVQKGFQGIPGCVTIHDNVLIHGTDVESHNKSLRATLERAKELGITFKLSEATICAPQVKWFGRVYSGVGVSADPDKIRIICEAGRPESIQDVKSLLQAAAYNAKFAFDHQEGISYEEATAPLRQLINKDAVFSWNEEREQSYHTLLRMLNDRSILTPFKPGRPTHLVTDASPEGISASLYQEEHSGRWMPVDHMSRALSQHERAWKSQIEWESLAKMWGMTVFRSYLIGSKFTSWGDQKPLVPLYNDFNRQATARISKHRSRVTDLTFTDKYLPGRVMPADYYSRHPAPISHLDSREREELMIDDGDDAQVMRVILADLPPVLSIDKLQAAAKKDPVYQRLIRALHKGNKPEDPELTSYTSIWTELSVVEDLVCRGERVVIPNSRLTGEEHTIREWVVELGHSGHMGMSATKRLLRLRLWFPGMDRMVEAAVASCLPCQAATDSHTKDPLRPSKAPSAPWKKLYCDHWGPTQDKKHILVITDALTRYPEVIVVDSTSAEANIHAFSEAFARQYHRAFIQTEDHHSTGQTHICYSSTFTQWG